MKYICKQCGLSFEDSGEADAHKRRTGHKVELVVGSTYWGEHLAAAV